MTTAPTLPDNAVLPKDRKAWRAWLARHHERAEGVWLAMYRKDAPTRNLDYEAAVQEALCFGWVDSRPRFLDDTRTLLWFAPRKAGSGWSAPNKARVEQLLAAGQMAPAGLRKVEAAKADGSWARLDAVESLDIPADLADALAASPPAAAHFEAFPRSVKRSILEWIVQAKKPETRAARVAETAAKAALNQRANQWKRPGAA